MAYDPSTPRPLPGLPWAPLGRREPLSIPPYSLPAAPTRHPTAATRISTRSHNHETSRLRAKGLDTQHSPAPPLRANTRPPAALTPVANYNFELRTQFNGRDVRGHIPYVEVRGHDYTDDSIRSEKPARKSVFREELQTVAGSEYDGDDEGSRRMRPRDD
ncbi:uncharacterized protein RCC_10534 [Ramularia collo-cygni]|uniref:Uncharacterized protein n=1 Tax=Ramularia collo-cygni TaxID=112498 RepID=A0A2D3V600_9PEZI|nr:uncharacterized protein RCC_10534 [Ramularia collo-cygni]CZT24806.1 uncharacterized protein RCC_10534 [Ramularia collo-cygni]